MIDRVPIICVERVLIVSIQSELHDRLALALQEDVNERLSSDEIDGVVIDISTVDVIDTFVGRLFVDLARSARLLGRHLVLSGMQPHVAMALVDLGLELEGVSTAREVDRARAMVCELASLSTC